MEHVHPYVGYFRENDNGNSCTESETRRTTCLNDKIIKLLQMPESFQQSIKSEDVLNRQSNLLDWENLSVLIDQSDDWKSAKTIQQLCDIVEPLIDAKELFMRHKQMLENTKQPVELIEHLLYKNNDEYLFFSIISTTIDRLAASVFLTVSTENNSDNIV
ncbi:hypothetical protein AKO1_010543, partial [Acrasis kona]